MTFGVCVHYCIHLYYTLVVLLCIECIHTGKYVKMQSKIQTKSSDCHTVVILQINLPYKGIKFTFHCCF